MSKEFSSIDPSLREFIGQQAMFFVATAPSEGGRINLSPKGYQDTFAVLDEHTVAYLDLFGSGAETIAHLRDNGRITLMFCSFTRNSRILRLFGTGRAVRPDDAEFLGGATGTSEGRWGWWWIVGPTWYFYPEPVYPYPNPYEPPVAVIVQPAPAKPAPPPPPPQNWYYCESAKGYYPYVPACPGGWPRTAA